MYLTYGYRIHPGRCHTCGTSAPSKVIDTSRDDPNQIRRSAVYLCEACVTAMWKMLEANSVLIDAQKLADMEGEIVALTNEVTRLMDEAAALDTRLAKALKSEVDA